MNNALQSFGFASLTRVNQIISSALLRLMNDGGMILQWTIMRAEPAEVNLAFNNIYNGTYITNIASYSVFTPKSAITLPYTDDKHIPKESSWWSSFLLSESFIQDETAQFRFSKPYSMLIIPTSSDHMEDYAHSLIMRKGQYIIKTPERELCVVS